MRWWWKKENKVIPHLTEEEEIKVIEYMARCMENVVMENSIHKAREAWVQVKGKLTTELGASCPSIELDKMDTIKIVYTIEITGWQVYEMVDDIRKRETKE